MCQIIYLANEHITRPMTAPELKTELVTSSFLRQLSLITLHFWMNLAFVYLISKNELVTGPNLKKELVTSFSSHTRTSSRNWKLS